MKEFFKRLFSILILVVFVNFVFSNVSYMHTHTLGDGSQVTHSHPYVPSSQHSHSSSQAGSITQANNIAAGFDAPAVVSVQPLMRELEIIYSDFDVARTLVEVMLVNVLRGPPAGL